MGLGSPVAFSLKRLPGFWCLLKVKKKIIINALCQLAVGCQFAEFPNPDQVSSVHPALGVGAWSLSVIAARWG